MTPNPQNSDLLKLEDIAETYCMLADQPHSAWTDELDLRLWSERF